mmetsp:Transcript_17401/g.35535  ORF Transcript_17401/g.35535 Transcript_17401/m.35535 type:complete len:537 (+) Transcript_17401:150-1760(+)
MMAKDQLSLAAESILDDVDMRPGKVIARTSSEGREWAAFSICSDVPVSKRLALHSIVAENMALNRAIGAVIGMCVGDSVGAPLEFLAVTDSEGKDSHHYYSLSKNSYKGAWNKFGLVKGQWTDDASMGLCLADSLISKGGTYDGSDVRCRYHTWWFHGYNNAFRLDADREGSVGLGGIIGASLQACQPGETPPVFFVNGKEDAGIGTLMRLAPLAVCRHLDVESARRDAARSSLATHPGPLAAECCGFLAHLLVRAIHAPWPSKPPTTSSLSAAASSLFESLRVGDAPKGSPVSSAAAFLEATALEYEGVLEERLRSLRKLEERSSEKEEKLGAHEEGSVSKPLVDLLRLLRSSEKDESTERCWNWKSPSLKIHATIASRGQDYNGYPVLPGYFGSFCCDGLAMALWSVYHTKSFDTAIERCVNLLGDADSTAAVCGQIAGAIYGVEGVGNSFIKELEVWDGGDTKLKAGLLYHLASKHAMEEASIGATATDRHSKAVSATMPVPAPRSSGPSLKDEEKTPGNNRGFDNRKDCNSM